MCRLKKFIIGENKKKSEFEQYKKLYSKYLNMDKQQFDFEYIKLKKQPLETNKLEGKCIKKII